MTNNVSFKMGHVLIKVADLNEAIKDYEKLGFTVVLGSTIEKATNAMIYFEDGSFIELFTASLGKLDGFVLGLLKIFRKLSPIKIDRYLNYLSANEGLTDFALDSSPEGSFMTNITRLGKNGITLSKPISMKRVDSKGCERKWQLAFAEDFKLPFFMDVYTPKFIPSQEEFTHPNGVTSISQLVIAVDKYDYFVDNYKKMTTNYTESTLESQFHFGDCCVTLQKSNTFEMKELHLNASKPLDLTQKKTHGVKLIVD